MSDKPKKTAADFKLIIEERLRAGHPECERAEVIINPGVDGRAWAASLFGTGPTTYQDCLRRMEIIVTQLRGKFDLDD